MSRRLASAYAPFRLEDHQALSIIAPNGRSSHSWETGSPIRDFHRANYRAAGRARSRAEFVAKLGIVLEEADETVFWLELMRDAEIFPSPKLHSLSAEANELVSIFVSAVRRAKEPVRAARN